MEANQPRVSLERDLRTDSRQLWLINLARVSQGRSSVRVITTAAVISVTAAFAGCGDTNRSSQQSNTRASAVDVSRTATLKKALFENYAMPGYETTWYSQIDSVYVHPDGAFVTMHSGEKKDTFICLVVLTLARDYGIDRVSVVGDGLMPEECWR
jgi:hypothetical protein